MAEFALILGFVIVGLVVTQLGFSTAAAVTSLKRERNANRLSQLLWWERVEMAHQWKAQSQLASAAGWNGHRKLVVDRRVVEAEGICSFYLVPHDGKALPRFDPGQYLTFQLDVPDRDQPVVRCYSLSDSPNEQYYRVTIKRVPASNADVPAGLVSNYFHDHINEGKILDVKAPSGRFVLNFAEKRPAVLIGGGVGITPVLSMINQVAASGSDREVWLFYAVRHGREQVMRQHLDDLDRKHENLHVVTICSNPNEDDVRGRDYDESGYLNVELLSKYLRDPDDRPANNHSFYICGPPPMMQSLLPQLEEWGVPKEHIHSEAFGPASVKARGKAKPPPTEETPSAQKKLQITFAKTGKQLTWDEQFANLLEFAADHGVQIDSACCAGGCGTCQIAVKSGDVVYDVAPDCEVEDGCCLTCVGRPNGDLILDA